MRSKPSSALDFVRSNWLALLVGTALLLLPHAIGWITGDSPFGMRGRPVGQSIYWQGVLIEVFILAILAMSYNLIFGFTGVISFGHALFFGMGGYTLAILLEKTGLPVNVGLPLGIVLALAVAALLGLLIGLVSLRLRGVYFAMFTLAVAEMFAIYFSRLPATQAEDGFTLADLPQWLDPTRSRLTYYYIALAIVVMTFLFIRRLIDSPTGAVLLAIRENEDRARAIGYDSLRFKLLSIILAGMLAALAGMLHVILNKKVGPEMLGIGYTVDPLLMTIIGGVGTFAGPVIGASGLHLSDRLLRDSVLQLGGLQIDIGDNWTLLLGVAFVVVVIIFPQGVVGTWRTWRARLRSQPSQTQG